MLQGTHLPSAGFPLSRRQRRQRRQRRRRHGRIDRSLSAAAVLTAKRRPANYQRRWIITGKKGQCQPTSSAGFFRILPHSTGFSKVLQDSPRAAANWSTLATLVNRKTQSNLLGWGILQDREILGWKFKMASTNCNRFLLVMGLI